MDALTRMCQPPPFERALERLNLKRGDTAGSSTKSATKTAPKAVKAKSMPVAMDSSTTDEFSFPEA